MASNNPNPGPIPNQISASNPNFNSNHPPSSEAMSDSNRPPLHQPVAARPSDAITAPDSLLDGYPHTHSPPSLANPVPHQTFGVNQSGTRTTQGLDRFAELAAQPEGVQISAQTENLPLQSAAYPAQLFNFPDPSVGFQTSSGPVLPVDPPASQPSQTPILNDALSYLDQVKIRFMDRADVYTHFLDIMKDFKSSAIDTPGVIERVSNLFAGHPMLIQGFNTFLPPGYLVECGGPDDPNAIRVTTPSGTMMQTITKAGIVPLASDLASDHDLSRVTGSGAALEQSEHTGSPREQINESDPRVPSGEAIERRDKYDMNALPTSADAQRLMGSDGPVYPTQRDLDGGSVASAGVNERNISQMPREDSFVNHELSRGLAGMNPQTAISARPNDGRSPVEFNHAISYVNKIKNRFAQEPEIYKQFLEILQTYQREAKPIQEVYAQVTELFSGAHDLLVDFKQFLPDTSVQPGPRSKLSDRDSEERSVLRDRDDHTGSRPEFFHHHHPVSSEVQRKQPPMGVFNPPITGGKEGKKRSRVNGAATASHGAAKDDAKELDAPKPSANAAGNVNKRSKVSHARNAPTEQPVSSPMLVPALPEPLPPSPSSDIHQDELALFDRIRKFIGNKQTFSEFLKLCHLCSQEIISIPTLIHRANDFIGSNQDLVRGLKSFMKYKGPLNTVENVPLPNHKVSLSNCRAFGPSYRLLPKTERAKLCSGRDPTCKAVLNDVWASHPTWASEVDGFMPHKKNLHEELLQRIEEERHDYDHNIEINERTTQLLEPIVSNIMSMAPEDQESFKLPVGLGGPNNAIYTRAIMKVYGREHGAQVVEMMYQAPWVAVPAVLRQLRYKVQEWKAIRREWQKLWQDQTEKVFWKSLDHQSANLKVNDKKLFTVKNLVGEILTRRTEQILAVVTHQTPMPRSQFSYVFADKDVVVDAVNLLISYVNNSNAYSLPDRIRIQGFLTMFFPLFFGFSSRLLRQSKHLTEDGAADDVSIEQTSSRVSSARVRRTGPVQSTRTGLLRDVLNPNRPGRHADGDDLVDGPVSDSVAPSSPGDDSASIQTTSRSTSVSPMPAVETWIMRPESSVSHLEGRPVIHRRSFARAEYNLYATQAIYGLVRLFQILYFRLLQIKDKESQVREDIVRRMQPKPANALRMITRGQPRTYFAETGPHANYYQQLLHILEETIAGTTDSSFFEDCLREYYIEDGWRLFTIEKLLLAVTRQVILIVGPEVRDKSGELISLWRQDCEKDHGTFEADIAMRKYAESLTGTELGYLFRITWVSRRNEMLIQLLTPDLPTAAQNGMTIIEKWSYYVASYSMIEPTETLRHDLLVRLKRYPYIKKNVADERLSLNRNIGSVETILMEIDPITYKRSFKRGRDVLLQSTEELLEEEEASRPTERTRTSIFRKAFSEEPKWMEGLSEEEVRSKMEAYKELTGNKEQPQETERQGAQNLPNGTADVEMS